MSRVERSRSERKSATGFMGFGLRGFVEQDGHDRRGLVASSADDLDRDLGRRLSRPERQRELPVRGNRWGPYLGYVRVWHLHTGRSDRTDEPALDVTQDRPMDDYGVKVGGPSFRTR